VYFAPLGERLPRRYINMEDSFVQAIIDGLLTQMEVPIYNDWNALVTTKQALQCTNVISFCCLSLFISKN